MLPRTWPAEAPVRLPLQILQKREAGRQDLKWLPQRVPVRFGPTSPPSLDALLMSDGGPGAEEEEAVKKESKMNGAMVPALPLTVRLPFRRRRSQNREAADGEESPWLEHE